MRADSALSHLYDGETCLADLKDGSTHEVRWSKPDWCFYYVNTPTNAVCSFDDIKDWRIAAIRH